VTIFSDKRWSAHRGMNPTRTVAVSFAALIALGTLLLLLPPLSRGGRSAGFFLSLYTAASATCVTGSVLADTMGQWTAGGQLVLLLLFQLGALGVMMAYSLLLLLFRRELVLSQQVTLASALGLRNIGGVTRLVRHGLVGTLLFEAGGTLLLALRFVPLLGWGQGLWASLFHSVSAFCNAGFDLMGGDLSRFLSDPFVLAVHMALTIVGGLGFFVWEDVLRAKRWRDLSLYSRLALTATGALLAAGWAYFLAAEWSNPATLGALPAGERVTAALFQSVNLRTAGFAVFPQGGMRESSQVVSLLFMVIGGCSGSTACGIKVVTALVLAAALWNGLRGRVDVVIRGRTVPRPMVRNAQTLTLSMLLAILAGSLVMAHIEGGAYLPVLFETVASIATVGLSAGAELSQASRWVMLGLMYLGRVGILSFSLAFLTRKHGEAKIRYPDCELFIG